jgi:hypothetical protein
MEIEQQIHSFTAEGEAVVIYTLRNGQGTEVHVTNLGATILSTDSEGVSIRHSAFDTQHFSTLLWESGVQTNWVVMSLDAGEHHLEAGFYLYDDNTLEITAVENGEQRVETIKL